jgi:chromosome partitioning protein
MHTIALVSRKGGAGKSTLAIGLAIAAAAERHKVCLLEADPLGTISKWRNRRTQAEPTVETVHDGYELTRRVPFLGQCGVTLTIIDTAGVSDIGRLRKMRRLPYKPRHGDQRADRIVRGRLGNSRSRPASIADRQRRARRLAVGR